MDAYERKIALAVVNALLSANPMHHIAVHDSEEFATSAASRDVDTIMAEMASTDQDRLFVFDRADMVAGQARGWVLLVWGNGDHLISDWSPSRDKSWLSVALDPVMGTLDN